MSPKAVLSFLLALLSGSNSVPLPSGMTSWPPAVKGVPGTSSLGFPVVHTVMVFHWTSVGLVNF